VGEKEGERNKIDHQQHVSLSTTEVLYSMLKSHGSVLTTCTNHFRDSRMDTPGKRDAIVTTTPTPLTPLLLPPKASFPELLESRKARH